MQRIRYLTVIIGTNGTGKTSLIKKIISKFNQSGSRALLVTPDDAEYTYLKDYPLIDSKEFDFKNVRKHIFEPNHTFNAISNNYRKGAVFFDDCRSYIPNNLESEKEFRNILIRRRHKEIDVFIIAHGFTDIPPKIFTYVNKYIIFKTTDPIVKRKDTILNYEAVEKAVKRINDKKLKIVDHFGKGKISYYEIISV